MRDDGNCLFRALSDQLPAAGEHAAVRAQVVAHMAAHPEAFEAFCPYDYEVMRRVRCVL
jgi:hypothetical protein